MVTKKLLTAGLLIVTSLSLTGCVSLVDVVSSKTANNALYEMEIGDCFNMLEGEDVTTEAESELSGITMKDCADIHQYEVYQSKTLTDAKYPADLPEQSELFCHGEFEAFAGIDYDSSELWFSALYPLEESWADESSHTITCVISQDGSGTIGTLAGAKR